jgi:acyl transferase domain-containing protein
VAAALEALRGAGVRARALPAAHAFHSAMMEPALPALSAAAGRARFRPAEVDFVSSVTGTLVDAGAAARPEYWAAQLRAPVRFADAVRALRAAGCTAFVEIGPQPTLLALARRTLPDEAGPFLPSLRPGRGDWETLLGSLARLHALGVEVDWDGFERPFASRPVSLPTYPFERRRHWIDVPAAPPSLDGDSAPAASSVDGFAASPVDGSAAPRASAGGAPVFASPAARAGSSNASGSTAHPLLGVRLDSPLDDVQFEVELAADSPALLDDHRVYGVPVVSGPTLAAMVAEAAARLAPGAAAAIENAAFVEPILLPPGERRTAQLVLHPLAAGRWEWRVLSRAAAGGGWTLHATGSLSTSSTPAGAAPHPDTVRLRLDEALTGGELYERVQRRAGFEFGRAYLWIDRLWRGPGEALGRFRAPDADEAGFERYRLHPGLHDSCFQVFGACSEAVMRAGDQDAVVPLGIDRLVVHAPARGDLWCHATLLPGEAGRDDMFSGGYTLFDAAGRVVLEARGLRLRRARREVMTRALRRPAGAALYRRAWHPAPPPPSADLSTSDETDAGAWLVVSGDAAGAGRLARALAARGQACTVATLAGAPHANGGPVLRAAAAGDFRRAVDALAVPGTPPLRGIVVIAGDEPPGSGDLAAFTAVAAVSGDASPVSGVVPVSADGAARHPAGNAGRDVLAATLSALQALAGRAWAGGAPGVWAVTRGAVDAGAEPLRVDAAAAWGLGRVAALEHPDLWRGCVDLPPASDDGEWARLADELLAGGGEDQVALRPGVRLAARLERVETVDADTDGAAPLVSADGSYLVTGGLGALGMELARWLAARGAGRVVLAGRSAPGAEARRALDELAAGGARVETACCDVAARGEVAALLGRIRREGPPLRGVFHAAGVLDDGALALQTAARFDAVMAPKTCGARHLHELTRGDAIGHFVLFSSAAALLGSAGQGGYAAANAVLDALAAGRRRAGLPALSVQWGPWTGGGMAASAPERAAWRARGISPLEPAQALAAMQRAMTAGAAAVAVLSVDWEAYAATAPRPDPLLATMVRPRPAAPAAPARPPTPDLPRRLRDAPADTRLALLRDHVRAEAARILGEDEGPGPRERFWEVGMDSLMAVELRGRLQSTLGVPLPATVVLDRPTVNQLAEHLLALVVRPEPAVHHGAVAASSSPHLPTAPGAADETEGWSAYDPAAVEAVRDLTDEETDALLLRELSALEGAP